MSPKSKLLKGIAGIATGATILCGSAIATDNDPYYMKDASIPQGIYDCSPTQGEGLEYALDTTKPTSQFLFDGKKGFTFEDENTGEQVTIIQDRNDKYTCKILEDISAPMDNHDNLSPADDRNWIAVHVWDSFYPLLLDETLPETLMSLEVIFQQHATYMAKRELRRSLGLNNTLYGNRSTEGHYMVQIHLSQEYISEHPIERYEIGDGLFLHADNDQDIFVGWGGEANLRDFVLYGVSGLANVAKPTPDTKTGSFHGFEQAVRQGTADFEGGFYITDAQAIQILRSFSTYFGLEEGYSFLSRIGTRTMSPYEPSDVQGTNGHNCIHYALSELVRSQVFQEDDTEKVKMGLWYPEKYWDHTIPLEGSGIKVFETFYAQPELYTSRGEFLKIGWWEFFTGSLSTSLGLEFFDERALVEEIGRDHPKYNRVRVWDQTESVRRLLVPSVHFRSKRVMEDLLPRVILGLPINEPFPAGEDMFRFRKSDEYRELMTDGNARMLHKLEKAGLGAKRFKSFKKLENRLKEEFLKR